MAHSRSFILIGLISLLSLSAFAQTSRYMIFFKDKAGTSYSVSRPLEFLSQKAVDRRIKQNLTITSQDLPVNINYVQGVRNTGAEVFFPTRWMNGVLVHCESSLIPSIQALSFVERIEFVAPAQKPLSGGRKSSNLRKKNEKTGIETASQLEMLGIPEMHQDGYLGEGMTIAVFDGGFSGVNTTQPFHHIFAEGRFNADASHDFVRNTKNVFQYDDHGTEVFSVMAAFMHDVFSSSAYKANYQLYVTEEVGTEYRVEEYNWMFAAERADSAGVDIISSSLGYYDFDISSMNYTTGQMDGKTTVITRAAQWVAERGIVVVSSAGNEGNIPSWRIVAAPSDAEDIIAVGNVSTQGIRASTSSMGPTADGRIKPDVVALGTGVRVITQNGNVGSASGTSLSTPLVTGLVAGIWQRYPDLTAKELMEGLRKSASMANNPNIETGYGIPHYRAFSNYQQAAKQTILFEVFPNPTPDTITLRLNNPEEIQSCIVELVSAQGQVLAKDTATFTWLNPVYQTNLSHLSEGIYYLRIWLGQQHFIFKVLKN
jgi:serine protease AprX